MIEPRHLCLDCDRAPHDPAFGNPMHLIHPERGAAMVFDIYGMAVCPTCSAIWYRDHKGTVLLCHPILPMTSIAENLLTMGPGTSATLFTAEQRAQITIQSFFNSNGSANIISLQPEQKRSSNASL